MTHTDWEKQLKGALLLIREEPVEVIFSGGVSKTISVIPWSMFVLAMDKLLADARKEVLKGLAVKMKKLKIKAGQTNGNPDDGWKELKFVDIEDVLASLREEEKPKEEKHGCCQCYCARCKDMCFRSRCVVHVNES